MELENIVANTVYLKAREGKWLYFPRKWIFKHLNKYFIGLKRQAYIEYGDILSLICVL